MEGWTLVAVTTVKEEFEGCDFGKRISFDNGWTLTCSTYSYNYAYRPDAAIFAKNFQHKGRAFWSIKALIEDEFYEMELIAAKPTRR